jgi:hypothetical protein
LARQVFISFRFSDGGKYKDELCDLFDQNEDVIDCSEDEDRSDMSEETIQKYLYDKLRRTSVTVVILTPEAIEYSKNIWTGKYDDWMYDELRYSLEDREYNNTKGLIAIYTADAKDLLITTSTHKCDICKKESTVSILLDVNNLIRKNMMNIKDSYKKNQCYGIYDSLEDSYISLVSYDDFVSDINKYIENAISKKERRDEFTLIKRL